MDLIRESHGFDHYLLKVKWTKEKTIELHWRDDYGGADAKMLD